MSNPFEIIETRLSNIENLLLDLKHKPKEAGTNPRTDQWFDLTELCEYLPDKPAKATVYGYVSANTIPCHKGLKKLRFLKSEIDNWLRQGRKKTVAEIEAETDTYLQTKKTR